jgi:hypothetical protein
VIGTQDVCKLLTQLWSLPDLTDEDIPLARHGRRLARPQALLQIDARIKLGELETTGSAASRDSVPDAGYASAFRRNSPTTYVALRMWLDIAA